MFADKLRWADGIGVTFLEGSILGSRERTVLGVWSVTSRVPIACHGSDRAACRPRCHPAVTAHQEGGKDHPLLLCHWQCHSDVSCVLEKI